ncbi:hypothetical protein NUACC26_067700 [Scytonema sp. NUACC26]
MIFVFLTSISYFILYPLFLTRTYKKVRSKQKYRLRDVYYEHLKPCYQ